MHIIIKINPYDDKYKFSVSFPWDIHLDDLATQPSLRPY